MQPRRAGAIWSNEDIALAQASVKAGSSSDAQKQAVTKQVS